MSAKRPDADCQPAYDAADLWIDRALKSDDSLFTPGVPIWSKDNLREARALFVDNSDVLHAPNLFDKLKRVMKSNPPEVYQLMGEALYVAYLILHKSRVGQAKKIERVNQVMVWSRKYVAIPDCLRNGLANGIMAPGQNINIKGRLETIITVAERWKRVGTNEMLVRRHPEYPRCFQEFLAKLKLSGALMVPPLHLIHPESFEPLAWENKVKVAKAPKFRRHVAGVPAKEVDRRIHRIRAELEREFPEGFDFYSPPIRRMWNDKRKK